jgi:hypothetical protein
MAASGAGACSDSMKRGAPHALAILGLPNRLWHVRGRTGSEFSSPIWSGEMTGDPTSRFDRWRGQLPIRNAQLVRRVVDELVPLYESAGFLRHKDYAGADLRYVGANSIGIQRREGTNWPTVEIQFDRRSRPSFNIIFAALPEICNRRTQAGSTSKISRLEANVVEGDASFSLCKGTRKNLDCTFGVVGFALFPDHAINRDFPLAVSGSKYLI